MCCRLQWDPSANLRRRPKTTESREVTRPGISAREIPARASIFQTLGMVDTSVIRERFTAVERDLNERSRRLLAAAEAKTAGHGGITAASLATGIARSTIGRGLKDLAEPGSLSGEVRRPGGGGPTLVEKDPTLLENLRQLVEPATMGDPMRPLMWVSKSHAKLAAALREMGRPQDRGQQYPQNAGLAEIPPAGEPQDPGRQS
jgi:hypothetical protein